MAKSWPKREAARPQLLAGRPRRSLTITGRTIGRLMDLAIPRRTQVGALALQKSPALSDWSAIAADEVQREREARHSTNSLRKTKTLKSSKPEVVAESRVQKNTAVAKNRKLALKRKKQKREKRSRERLPVDERFESHFKVVGGGLPELGKRR